MSKTKNATLSVCVLAHPNRKRWFDYLREKLGNDASFQIDYNSEGNWPNAQKAWAQYDASKDYHLVIQDDSLVCDNFYERLQPHLNKGYYAYGLYWGNDKKIKYSKKVLSTGYTTHRLIWGVAIVLQTKIIPNMLEWTGKRKWPRYYKNRCDDSRISRFLENSGYTCYYPIPSLVDHRTGDNVSITCDTKSTQRRALYYIDR